MTRENPIDKDIVNLILTAINKIYNTTITEIIDNFIKNSKYDCNTYDYSQFKDDLMNIIIDLLTNVDTNMYNKFVSNLKIKEFMQDQNTNISDIEWNNTIQYTNNWYIKTYRESRTNGNPFDPKIIIVDHTSHIQNTKNLKIF
jgi:hypothetical protein